MSLWKITLLKYNQIVFGKQRTSLKGNTEEDEAESRKEEVIPQFKMIGVHMAGLKAPEEEEEEKEEEWWNQEERVRIVTCHQT